MLLQGARLQPLLCGYYFDLDELFSRLGSQVGAAQSFLPAWLLVYPSSSPCSQAIGLVTTAETHARTLPSPSLRRGLAPPSAFVILLLLAIILVTLSITTYHSNVFASLYLVQCLLFVCL